MFSVYNMYIVTIMEKNMGCKVIYSLAIQYETSKKLQQRSIFIESDLVWGDIQITILVFQRKDIISL